MYWDCQIILDICIRISSSILFASVLPVCPNLRLHRINVYFFTMMSYRSLSIFAILNVYLYFSTGFAANPCFFPDGSSDPAFVPCSPNGDGSCCFSSDTCTQYGYCLNISTGYHYRGACTDSAWLNPSCPDYCLDNENCKFDQPSVADAVITRP